MPLLRNLPDVLSANPNPGYYFAGQYLNRLLTVSGNIEELLTILYRLDESFFKPRHQNSLDADWIDQIFASSALHEFFTDPGDGQLAIAVLKVLRVVAAEGPGAAVTSLSPGNFFRLFQGALVEYFQASFRRYPCPLHLRLFQGLNRNDCVVSFNYDEIADYSLYSAGKLTRLSFEGLGFEEIFLPARAEGPLELGGIPDQLRERIPDLLNRVKFLKIHGSINWWGRMQEMSAPDDGWTYKVSAHEHLRQSARGGPEVRYCLDHPGDKVDRTNWTPAPIIFPFLTKDFIYRGNAMFARHLVAFQEELRAAHEIVLVGKTFQNSDSELNGMIRYASHGKAGRVLHIVDPNTDPEFERYHCSLFSARLGDRYWSFREYGNVSPG
jgi:hypothetical protein